MFVGFHALFLKIVLATLYYISIEYLNAYTINVVTSDMCKFALISVKYDKHPFLVRRSS